MDTPTLMNQLMEMERALCRHDECAVRNLILQAQDGVLSLERENEQLALDNAGLRLRLDEARRSEHKSPALRDRTHGGCHEEEAPAPATLADDSLSDPKTPVWRMTHFFFN
ncbi:MAG: hypothetical protein ACLGXA_17265 [Acidobacteriota bacterium]